MFDEEKLNKKLQKIPRSKSLETRKQGVIGKLTQEEAKQWFRYKDGKLYWGKSPRYKTPIGSEAGFICKTYNRRFVGFKDKIYPVSHIIFLLVHGYYPKYVHFIDGNKLNTKINNLKASTSSIKTHTAVLRQLKGIYEVGKKYRVVISFDGKRLHVGTFKTLEDAKKAYNLAAKKIYSEFAVLHDLTKEE